MALLALHSPISPLISSVHRNRASWASQPQKSVTLLPCLGGRTTKSTRTCGALGGGLCFIVTGTHRTSRLNPVTLLFCICEILISSLGRDTNCPPLDPQCLFTVHTDWYSKLGRCGCLPLSTTYRLELLSASLNKTGKSIKCWVDSCPHGSSNPTFYRPASCPSSGFWYQEPDTSGY